MASIIELELAACIQQAYDMRHTSYGSGWSPVTLERARHRATCVSFPGCVLQRLGVLKSGQYIWQNGRGFGTGRVHIYGRDRKPAKSNIKLTTVYPKPNNKDTYYYKDILQPGDILYYDDNRRGESGGGGHIVIFSGLWDGKAPKVFDFGKDHNCSHKRAARGCKDITRSYGGHKLLAYTRLSDGSTYTGGTFTTASARLEIKKRSESQEDVKKGACTWAKVIAEDNSFHYGKGPEAHRKGCYFCDTQPVKKRDANIKKWKKTYCCNTFVFSAFAHGGGEKYMHKLCKNGKNNDVTVFEDNVHFKDMGKLQISSLKEGDVLWYRNEKKGTCHYALYIGDDQVAEAIDNKDDNKENSKGWNQSIRIRKITALNRFEHVSRYIGSSFGGKIEIPNQEGLLEVVYTGGTGIDREDNGQGLNLQQSISKLYSSDNYERLNDSEEKKDDEVNNKITDLIKQIKLALNNVDFEPLTPDSQAILEPVVTKAIELADFEKNKPNKILEGKPTQLLSYPTLVEAPTIVLDFNGAKIGGYGNVGDKYPNYITSMTVKKINGRINQYNINLSYQVRFGEDPNFIDKLISKTGYTNPLKILYGDSNFPSGYYREESAVITDVKHSEDYSAYKINYTISAISSIGISAASLTTFPSKTDKPSNLIYKLLYESGEISENLLDIFPGMRNRLLVSSSNLIPVNDLTVNIGGMSDTSPLNYLKFLVANMTSNNDSTYYLNLIDNSSSEFDGSYFEIKEVVNNNNKDMQDFKIISNYYELDIGYPSNNLITNFQICSNNYWSLIYDYAKDIPKYDYTIDDSGNVVATKTNVLYNSSKYNESNLVNSNWWKQVTDFPISAKVRLKGLITPAILMSYIKINALFYGQRDMASGLYVVTQQEDSISGSGYSTELTLLRVAGD